MAVDSSGLLNDSIRKVMEGLGIKKDGFVLIWFEGETMHVTADVPWKLIASKIPWNKLAEMIPKEELATHLFSWIGKTFGKEK